MLSSRQDRTLHNLQISCRLLSQEAEVLKYGGTSGAHLGIVAHPHQLDGVSGAPAGNADEDNGRPKSLAEANEMGIELTDKERKEFKRQWRIAKNERRKAKNAVGRAARQVQKAAHHQVTIFWTLNPAYASAMGGTRQRANSTLEVRCSGKPLLTRYRQCCICGYPFSASCHQLGSATGGR